MIQLTNPMEIFKLLDRSNCRKCRELTCLAFAAAVFKGQRRLIECPNLEGHDIEPSEGKSDGRMTLEQEMEFTLEELKNRVASVDLASAAPKLGASFSDSKLTIKVLGKNLSVDSKGNITTDIHIHSWVTIPVLNHIIRSKGTPVSGEWVPLRELKNGKTWHRLFEQQCEKPLKRVADIYADLFEDMIRVFKGKQVEKHSGSDFRLVLRPLPKVPILICYARAEDGLESNLNIFFDSRVEDHLNIECIYTLGVGLAKMFNKIALRHSFQ
ncbi:MAG: DUF3786 domain-containing protein [Deltaproteobacteria bacterium]|nr:MAG: DUF3786 domain-containing protein [Deltaproteobacteria bacterium]